MLLSGCFGCRTTVDSLGYNDTEDAARRQLQPLSGPASYPNALRDVCGVSDDEIRAKINNVFNTLFHGNPADQAIYFEVGADQANIKDVLHNNEVRTEGMGLGMLIAVEFNKQPEFDRLWRYAKQNLIVTHGPKRGYFNSFCDAVAGDTGTESDSSSRTCYDPFGLQQFAMALILAHGRWGEEDNATDAGAKTSYNDDALQLLDVMRNKEEENGGIVDGTTNTFDANTLLVFDEPIVADFNFTRPGIEMPAYYEMWAQATGDSFWSAAAANARSFWKSVANSETGLIPVRAYFSGREYDNWNVFSPEGYRVLLNITWDSIWTGVDSWNGSEATQLIDFFSNVSNYVMSYQPDGTAVDNSQAADGALISANGDIAMISSSSNRESFICDVWGLPIPTGSSRYYAGTLYLLSLLTLSGEFRVY